MSGWPRGPGSYWKRLASLHGRVKAAGTAGGQRSLLEGQGQQDLPEEEQPTQSTRGTCRKIQHYVSSVNTWKSKQKISVLVSISFHFKSHVMWLVWKHLLNSTVPLQVLCPCAKRRERRDAAEPLDDPLDDSDTNTLGLSAQDLRDPAAIVSVLMYLLVLSFSVLLDTNIHQYHWSL